MENPSITSGGQGLATSDPSFLVEGNHRTSSDINLIRRAIREGWAVPQRLQEYTVDRLTEIMLKKTVTVMGKDGPAQIDGPADANAIRAAAVLVSMTKQNQDDDHKALDNNRLDAGLQVASGGVVVNVLSVTQKPTTPKISIKTQVSNPTQSKPSAPVDPGSI